ncbi:hypothetical protein KIS4809_4828 [Bacillus sp. ZZV12-4809]|nr:hypothetical protein KIS4809_4828 [Bacillus sp. ZZV12-4809]
MMGAFLIECLAYLQCTVLNGTRGLIPENAGRFLRKPPGTPRKTSAAVQK